MPDQITAKDQGAKFVPHPEGQFGAVCVDLINLGERVEQYQKQPARVVSKCAIVFASGERAENGDLHTVSAEFTVSMNEKAGLRQLLEAWRGRSYREEEAKAGVPLHKLCGHAALMSVEHKTSGAGRTYAKIRTISPLPKGMEAPDVAEYQRAEFWEKRRTDYAEEVARFRSQSAAPSHDEDFETDQGEDDDLPF